MKNYKVLITVPDLSRPGGVSALYNILKLNQDQNIFYYQIHGKLGNNKILRIVDMIYVYIRFAFKILKVDIVHVNPSLTPKSYYRDALFVYISLLFGKKVLVYWHGWDSNLEGKIKKSKVLNSIFQKSFAKAQMSIVLGNVFADKLRSLGCKGVVVIESNSASDEYIDSVIEAKSVNENISLNLLFLARIETEKGVYIAIDAVKILSEFFKINLVIAGGGGELENAKNYVLEKNIDNVKFIGHIHGEQKHNAFEKSDMFLFPTYYNEGMPISIIEAMLYGLPVISRPVGGIPDWVENYKNGVLLESKEPADFAAVIKELYFNPKLFNEISNNNLIKSKRDFIPSAVKARLLSYYSNLKAA